MDHIQLLLEGETSPEDTITPAGENKRNASQLSPDSEEKAPSKKDKKEIKSGIPVGFGAMPGQK